MDFREKFCDRGFSLVEVLLGGSLLCAIALGGATLFKNQKQAQKLVFHDQELQDYHKILTDTLTNVNNCNATFKKFYDGRVGEISTINTCPTCTTAAMKDDAQTVEAKELIGIGTYTSEAKIWRIKNLKVQAPLETGRGTLEVNYKLHSSIGVKEMKKDIPLNFRFHDKKFKECFNDKESSLNNLQNDLCHTLIHDVENAGKMVEWNAETQTCEHVSGVVIHCNPFMVIDGITSDGAVHCAILDSQIKDMEKVLDPPGSTIADCSSPYREAVLQVSGNKFSVSCR